MNVAIILCCYNRIKLTERCLIQIEKSVRLCQQIDDYKIYICDDASNDGTSQMIRNRFPEACLIVTEGNCYWANSMYKAMLEAQKVDFDIYLMVNDDVSFFDRFISIMMDAYAKASFTCGIVGTTLAVDEDKITYGGRDMNMNLITPQKELKTCFWANWNCFLIDKEVVKKIGIIDGKYEHSYGDFDYAYRMNVKGIPIYIAEEYVGRCNRNTDEGTYKDKNLSRIERIRKLFSPKGCPIKSYMRFNLKTGAKYKFLVYIMGYLSIIYETIKK